MEAWIDYNCAGLGYNSVDVEDLLSNNNDIDFLEIQEQKPCKLQELAGKDEEKTRLFFPSQQVPLKDLGEKKNSANKNIFYKGIDWIKKNPGVSIFGAILFGSGIAYALHNYRKQELKSKRKKRKRTLQGSQVENMESKDNARPLESISANIIAACGGALLGASSSTLNLIAGFPAMGYGIIAKSPIALWAGAGLILSDFVKKIFKKKSDLTILNTDQNFKESSEYLPITKSNGQFKGRENSVPLTDDIFYSIWQKPIDKLLKIERRRVKISL